MRPTDAIGLVSVMPQACRIGRPVWSRNASDSALGTAEPPHGMARSADVSRPLSSGSTPIQIGGHARGDGDLLVLDEVGDGRRRQVGAGHHEVGAARHRGVGEAPGVGVEHRHDGQDDVALRQPMPSASMAPIVCRNVERCE